MEEYMRKKKHKKKNKNMKKREIQKMQVSGRKPARDIGRCC